METHDDSKSLWAITDVPYPLFNGILRGRLDPDQLDGHIEAAITRGHSRKVPLLWWTGPATRPADLGKHLEVHGFTHEGDVPGMAADLFGLEEVGSAPPDFTVAEVGGVEILKTWCRIAAALTLRALREARVMGSRVGILHSSAMAVAVYRKLGFQEYCKIGHYPWSPELTR